MVKKVEIEDLLRFEGIECKGYGILPKFLMWDTALSAGAKSLYAYYCSLAGTETIAFPCRETIVRQLQINKDTFYVYLKELMREGYILVHQEREGTNSFGHNVYTLCQNPKKLSLPRSVDIKNEMDTVYFSGIKSYGYGIIPRIVMQDIRLTIKEKALYAYLVVYSGAGHMSLLKRSLILEHLAISKNTYTKYLQRLVQLGYLTVQRRTDSGGKFTANAYILNHNPGVRVKPELRKEPASAPPCPKNPDTEKSPSPCPKNPDTGKSISPCPKNPDTGKSISPCPKNPDTGKSTPPCPKNPDTGKSNSTVSQKPRHGKIPSPCPNLPCPRNPDINNKYTNTSKYTNTRSIDPLDLLDLNHSLTINGKIDRWKKSELKNFALPEERILSESEIEQFLKVISGTQENQRKYKNDLEQQAYELFMDALIDLCTMTTEITVKGTTVTYAKVIKRINRRLGNKNFVEAYLDFEVLEGYIIKDFTKAIRLKEIKDPFRYMKSCIWNGFITSEVRFHVQVEQGLEI